MLSEQSDPPIQSQIIVVVFIWTVKFIEYSPRNIVLNKNNRKPQPSGSVEKLIGRSHDLAETEPDS